MPADSGLAYVAITHLSPDYPSELPTILRRIAAVPVERIRDGIEVAPDRRCEPGNGKDHRR